MPGVALLELAFLFAIDAVGRLDIGVTKGSIPGAVAIGAKQICGDLPESSELKIALDAPPIAAVVEEVVAAETADIRFRSDFHVVVAADQLRLKTEQVPWVDVAAAIDRPLHHHLGLKAELGVAAEGDRFEVATDEQAIAVIVVDPEHPAVFNFLFLLDQLPPADGHGQALFDDEPIAPRRDQQISIRLVTSHHILGIDAGLGRSERVIAETHPVGTPSVGGDLNPCGLNPPTADCAVDQLCAAQSLELRHPHHTETVLVAHTGIQSPHGHATASFD